MKQYFAGIAAVVVCMGVGSALAQEGKHEEKAVNASEIVNTVCTACHGEDGNKMLTPETPKLGGQVSGYLAKALHDYRDGKRKNPIMGAVAQPLSDAEIEALAHYFSAQSSQLVTVK
jgi:cytochrome c553